MIKRSIYILFTLLGAGLFVACNENIHDFTKKTGYEAANDVYITDAVFNFPLNRTADAEITGVDSVFATFRACSTLAAENEITVKLSLDNELVKVYNTVHGTSYNSILPDSLTLKTTTLTIPKGETRSSDSIKISYKGKLKYLTDTRGYLIPVRINSYSGADVKINYESRVGYLFVNVTQENGIGFAEASGKITNNPALALFDSSFDGMKFKLSSLFKAATDATVTLTINNSLIADYNASMGTDYQAVSASDFDPVTVTLNEGAASAEGALSYKGDISTLTNPKGYVVPVEITSVAGTGINKINAKKVFYAILDISNLYSTVVADDTELGTRVTDRSKYSVVKFVNVATGAAVTPANGAGAQNNMFADATTFWVVSGSPKLDITIDLGAEIQNISGLHLLGWNAVNNIKTFDIYYATKQSYDSGQSSLAGKITFPATQGAYIKFSEPVDARYIMLNNMTGATMYGMQQFYIYTSN